VCRSTVCCSDQVCRASVDFLTANPARGGAASITHTLVMSLSAPRSHICETRVNRSIDSAALNELLDSVAIKPRTPGALFVGWSPEPWWRVCVIRRSHFAWRNRDVSLGLWQPTIGRPHTPTILLAAVCWNTLPTGRPTASSKLRRRFRAGPMYWFLGEWSSSAPNRRTSGKWRTEETCAVL